MVNFFSPWVNLAFDVASNGMQFESQSCPLWHADIFQSLYLQVMAQKSCVYKQFCMQSCRIITCLQQLQFGIVASRMFHAACYIHFIPACI